MKTTRCISIQYCSTAIGELIIGSFAGKLCLLDFRYRNGREKIDRRLQNRLNAAFVEQDNQLLQRVRRQLDEYFSGRRSRFDIPLLLTGSDFQRQVWHGISRLPYGTTATYQQLARAINHERAVRATANACGANAIVIIIPCHRVISSNGQLTGYAGGTAAKEYLLKLEQNLRQ